MADETGYSIKRRDVTASGVFAEIDTVGPGVELYDDVGPFTAGHRYEWLIEVQGGALDGGESNVVGAFGAATLFLASPIGLGVSGMGIGL